ncbi:zinc ribbon domain-containing protein [uncultured Parasphingorhabdus sp.]|uniref:zinc ribbon domain-containing protein n=1 Tax=uncultured Parasphingorhabdus sp. TaxID=2709694 RepID=UPI0030DAEEB0|tara:strand:+ start:12945 stop:13469 length:525 start_codon:yes stop_codon:yes gene_type:complete
MICTSCGTENQADAIHCTNCGEALPKSEATAPSATRSKSSDPGIASGCLILLRTIFSMPIRTAHLAAHELRKIAKAGALVTDKDFPHLFWCKAMLPVVATFLSALAFVVTLGSATVMGGIIGFFAGLFAAALAAIVADWFIMIVGEYLMVKVVSVQYYKMHIEEAEREITRVGG